MVFVIIFYIYVIFLANYYTFVYIVYKRTYNFAMLMVHLQKCMRCLCALVSTKVVVLSCQSGFDTSR